ncbi:MAG: hypothetical protein LUG54_01715 [Clostridiales bacterium]|nr:hypothetical protein [Clostridiales bacterium]
MQLKKNPRKKPKLKQWSKRLLVLLVAGGMLLGLTACEESVAFKEYEYWYDAEEIDPEVDPALDNQEENEEETEEIASADERDYSEEERYFDESESLHDDEAEDEGESADATYTDEVAFISAGESDVASSDAEISEDTTGTAASTEETSSDGYAVTGTDTASDSTSGIGSASEDGDAILGETEGDSDTEVNPGVNDDDNEDSDLDTNTNGTDETGAEGDDGIASDEGGENGSQSEENTQQIVSCGAVIATGEAAILTQMLGGAGSLYATDQVTYNAMAEYFPADELADIEILWSGDSTGSINADSLDALIAEGKNPQAALLDSTALNSSDVSALNDRGISCTALTFDSYDSILTAVRTVANVLGTDEAAQRQAEYVSFCDSISEMVGDYDSEKYTLFVSGWDSAAQLSFSTIYTGTWKSRLGVAIACMLSDSPADEMWNLAGVQSVFSQSGYKRTGHGNTTSETFEILYGSEYQYLCQYYVKYQSPSLLTPTYDYTMEVSVNWLLYKLGDSDYPAVIAATQEVASSWLADKNYSSETQDAGMYTVGHLSSTQRYLYDHGISSGIMARISDEYEVYVNPSGLGDWAEGSAESILEAAWIAWKIQGACDEDQVREKIEEYYATFYRCTDLTDAQVDAILAGKES